MTEILIFSINSILDDRYPDDLIIIITILDRERKQIISSLCVIGLNNCVLTYWNKTLLLLKLLYHMCLPIGKPFI